MGDHVQPIEEPAPYWDIVEAPKIDDSTEQYEFVEYREKNVAVDNLTTYEINCADLDLSTYPSDSYFRVGVNITSAAGGAVTGGNIALVNAGYNLFSEAYYYMNDKLVEYIHRPGLAQQVLGLVDTSDGFKKSTINEMWYPDDGNGLAGPNALIPTVPGVVPLTAAPNGVATTFITIANGVINTNPAVAGAAVAAVQLQYTPVGAGAAINIGTYYIYPTQTPAIASAGGGAVLLTGGPATGLSALLRDANGVPLQLYVTITQGGVTQYMATNLISNGTNLAVSPFPAVGAGITTQLVVALSPTPFSSNLNPTSEVNQGFIERAGMLYNQYAQNFSQQLFLWLPVVRIFKFFEQNCKAFRGIKHTFRFNKNLNNADQLLSDTGVAAGAIVKINYLSWFCPVVRPSNVIEEEYVAMLKSPAEVPMYWSAIQLYESQVINSGSQTYNWRICSSARRPRKLYVVFQNQSRYNNQYANNMLFDNGSITNIYVMIGGTQFPRLSFSPISFGAAQGNPTAAPGDIARLYNAYLRAANKIDTYSDGACLSYQQFRDNYPIFVFDVEAQNNDIWANPNAIDIMLYVNGTNLSNLVAYCIMESDAKITVKGNETGRPGVETSA